jgi:hypothetical protein
MLYKTIEKLLYIPFNILFTFCINFRFFVVYLLQLKNDKYAKTLFYEIAGGYRTASILVE